MKPHVQNVFKFIVKLIALLTFFNGICTVANAQTGYIYVTKSTVDESSNPTSGGFAFTGAGSGSSPGATVISGFTLNDAPTTINVNDIGAASSGMLFAGTASGLYYRAAGSSTWVLAGGTSGFSVNQVDGGPNNNAIFTTSSAVYIYDQTTNTVASINTSTNVKDVAWDRVNNRVILVNSSSNIFYASVIGVTAVGSFTQDTGAAASRVDADNAGNLLILGTNGHLFTITNYTSSPTNNDLGYPSGTSIVDIAAADDGSYFVSTTSGPVDKYGGSANSFTSEPSSGYSASVTGGPGGQVWEIYNVPGYTTIWTRELAGTTPNWIDDERVRATLPGNSEMIAVLPGTYTITETPNTPNNSWNLQKISIYDPGSSSNDATSVTNSTATVTVTAGEVVHITYQNYYAATTAFANNCSTSSFTETFGSGTAGTLGTIGSGEIGATSYHFGGSGAATTVHDGYYGIAVQSQDVGYGTQASFPNTKDHTNPGTGYFLFFNASFQTDVFYQREFTGLVPGNPYTITYYIANITGSGSVGGTTTLIPPNVTAQMTDPVSGAVLASATTGNITAVGVWTKETFTFTPGATQISANFSLVNNAIGGSGNDVGFDDISFVLQPAGSVTATVHNVCGGAAGTSTITVTSPLGSAYQYSINGTTYQTSPIFTGLTQGTTYSVYASYVGSTSCNSSASVYIPNNTYTWTGSTSTDPTVGSNWSGGVAPAFDGNCSLVIPYVSTFRYPALTANESIFSLTISSAPAFFNLGSYTLNVGCNIVNSVNYDELNIGTDLTNSTINWDGDSANQSYTGNSIAGTAAIGNMTVNNTYTGGAGVVTISGGPVDIYNSLNVTEGNLVVSSAANTALTLHSTATQTANVSAIVSPGSGISVPTVTGNVNVQRYITGGSSTYRGYRLMSSPVNISGNTAGGGYLSLSYINTTVGSNNGALTGGPGAGYTVSNPNPTIYLYNEAATTNITRNYTQGKNIGIYAITGNTVTTLSTTGVQTTGKSIPVGNGYIFYFIGDNSSTATASSRTIQNTTLTAIGTLNQGNVPVTIFSNNSTSLSFTNGTGANVAGLNQVGNPYASTISLDQVYADNYNSTTNAISPNYYEMNEPGQGYISYNASTHATSNSRAGKYVVSGQGFMTQATATGQTLTFKEDQKVSTQLITSPAVTTPATPALLLALKLNTNAYAGMHLQLTSDADTLADSQTGIYFSSAWSDAYEPTEDALDLNSTSSRVDLSTLTTDGMRVCINEMGDYSKTKRIKLFAAANTTGQYHFGLVDIENIDSLYNVYLVDNLQKDSVNLRGGKLYDFTITTTDTTTFGGNRFVLAIEPKPMPPYQLLSFTGQKNGAVIPLKWTTANEGMFTGFTLQKLSGTKWLGIDSLQSNGGGSYNFVDGSPVLGLNSYRLMQNGITGAITYSDVVTVNTATDGPLSVYPNPTHGNINVSVNLPVTTYKINIYNSFGGVMKQQTVSSTNWSGDITSYNDGTYIVEATDANGKLLGKTKIVKVK